MAIRDVLLWLSAACAGIVVGGCARAWSPAGRAWDVRPAFEPGAWKERLMGPQDWGWQSPDGRVRAELPADPAGPFGKPLMLICDYAHVEVGPLAALMLDGEPLAAKRVSSGQKDGGLELVLAGSDGREVTTRIRPGQVTTIEVDGADQLTRLTLPVKLESVDRLVMDYGWIMERPGAFQRSRVMTNFVLAESAGTAVLLGCDVAWRFDVDPAGRIAAVALHRAGKVRFFVGVGPKGQWAELVAAYRQAAHPDWDNPAGPANRREMRQLVGRMVLDDWSGLRYDETIELLRRLEFLGCTRLVVVRHNWQHHGYDVKLPDTWPPNERFGGLEAMERLASYCRSAGMLFGLHENFDDLYRDAPTFDEWALAYHPREWHNGQLREYKGWYNESTKQQAVRHTPASALQAMRRNLGQQLTIRPSTTFLDVTSYTDPDPVETVSGPYMGSEKVLEAEREMYRRAAALVGGPVLGEGSTEKFLGAVDGANCDLWHVDRWGNKASPADWEFFPLLDWLAHDRVVFQGVGYAARFGQANQARFTAALYGQPFLDNYNSVNILFGHAPLHFAVSAPFALDALQIARQYWLGVVLHEAVGLRRIVDVAPAGDDIHRLTVRYADGRTVWVNRSAEPWVVQGHTLGRYGYLVEGPKLRQRLWLEDGAPLEVVEADDVLYVDFRGRSRRYKGVEADGAVLVRRAAGLVDVVSLGGHTGSIRVQLDETGLLSGARVRRADLVDVDGKRRQIETRDGMIEFAAPSEVGPASRPADALRRSLQKVVVQLEP